MSLKIKKQLKNIIETPMSDSDIRIYLPSARIVEYPELSNYNSIEELLPDEKSYIILMYKQSPQYGHWVAVMREPNNIFSYFDPYGLTVDAPLKYWNTKPQNKKLGQSALFLSNLFDETKHKVMFNDVNYQSSYNKLTSTCGAHCIFRILQLLKHNMTLKQYYTFMKKLKKQEKLTWDEIVAKYISIR
jgi:hypothetical protein